MSSVLDRLAHDLTTAARSPLPPPVLDAARRTLFNVLATTVGAAEQPATEIVVGALAPFAESAGAGLACSVPGRVERLAPLDAALAVGVAAHLDDYDDTHLRTVIHPGAVELATLVALQHDIGDRAAEDVLAAVAWGVEAQLRLGNAVSPEHYDAGWHITGTCGPVGAAVTGALLACLSAEELTTALRLAVAGAVGNREGFGSMTKPFHPGVAAVHGLRAVELAQRGISVDDTLDGPDGFSARLADGVLRAEEVLSDLGHRWEILDNAFKPYPCGIVTHPAIEAAEALHSAEDELAAEVDEIVLTCHPLVPELTGNLAPTDGLQARFSTAHGVAAGLLTGRVDLAAYADDFVGSEAAVRLRSRVRLVPDEGCARDEAHLAVRRGTTWTKSHVEHARGSLARPLTEPELLRKAEGLVEPILPGGARLLDELLRSTTDRWWADVLSGVTPDRPPRVTTPALRVPEPSPDRRLAEWLVSDPVGADPRLSEVMAARWPTIVRAEDPRVTAMALARDLDGVLPPAWVAAMAGAAAVAEDRRRAVRAASTGSSFAVLLGELLDIDSGLLCQVASGTAAAAAAGVGAGVMLDLLGLTATQVTGIRARSGDGPTDLLQDCADGVTAALLAGAGFTGPARPLTGRRGLVTLLGVRAPDPGTVIDTQRARQFHDVASAGVL